MDNLFALGRVVATPGALEAFKRLDINMLELLLRHAKGDWGELDPQDVRANNEAVKVGLRILSSYPLSDAATKVWIITEADRSSTTFLLPDEY